MRAHASRRGILDSPSICKPEAFAQPLCSREGNFCGTESRDVGKKEKKQTGLREKKSTDSAETRHLFRGKIENSFDLSWRDKCRLPCSNIDTLIELGRVRGAVGRSSSPAKQAGTKQARRKPARQATPFDRPIVH